MNNIHFIVGMSRAGTEWMTKSLNNHSKVCAYGETAFFGRNSISKENFSIADLTLLRERYDVKNKSDITTDVAKAKGGMYAVILSHIEELIEKQENISKKSFFNQLSKKLLAIEEKDIAIEKTPHHINHLKEIRRLYPASKIIIMKRDAAGFMLSYKHQGDRKEKEAKNLFKMIYHPIGCCLVYRKYLNSVNAALSFPNTHLVEFSRLAKEPQMVVEEVQRFLNIPIESIVIPKANSSFPTGKKVLKTGDKLWLWLFGFTQFPKYTLKNWVVLPFELSYLLVKFPVWSVQVIHHYQKGLKGNLFSYFFNILRG